MKSLFTRLVDFAAFGAFRAVEFLLSHLSIPACETLGETLGSCLYRPLFPYRKLVLENLARAFPDWSETRRERVARNHFATLGRNFALSIRFGSKPPPDIEDRFSYEGLEHLEKALAAGNGCVVAIPHFSTWEMYAWMRPFGDRIPLGAVYQRLHNPLVDRHLIRSREASGTRFFERSDGLTAPIQFLREGGILGVLFDQNPGDRGAFCPFFRRLVATSTLPGVLAQRTGAPVVYARLYPDGSGRWRVVFDEPIPAGAPDDRFFPSRAAALLNEKLESTATERPEEWFWVHRRWKISGRAFVCSGTRAKVWPVDSAELEKLEPFRLLVRSPNPLGDACMALPAVRALKRGRPDVLVTVCCRENLAPMWRAQPEVDAVIPFGKDLGPCEVGRIIRETGGSFDAGVLLPNSFRSALELRCAGVRYLAGYDRYRRKFLLRAAVPEPKPDPGRQHHVYRYLHLVGRIGADIRPIDDLLQIPPAPTPIRPGAGEIRFGICPGAEYGDAKRYPIERYAEAAAILRERRPDLSFQICIFGSPNERAIGNELAAQLVSRGADPNSVHNRVGETTIAELVEELKTCHFLATNDTGTMHLAAALGVPTVAIFGSTEPDFTSPVGSVHRVIRHKVDCSPCFLRECPIDYRCMLRIPPEEVTKEMECLLPSRNP